MFQYAVGRHLAFQLGAIVKLDISWFAQQNLRIYRLGVFNLKAHIASKRECDQLIYKKRHLVERIFSRLLHKDPQIASSYIKEKESYHFDHCIMQLGEGVYLDGYWQSEKYFVDISDIILREFQVKTPIRGKNEEMAKRITSCESISMHIRRGDYIDKNILISDPNYYFKCIEYVAEKIRDPHYFIFSDDPEWVKKKVNIDYSCTIVDYNGAEKCYEDLRLMTLCKHNIIANSTFSWWGAWLNTNPNKIVLSSINWIARHDHKPKDLFPDNWVKL